MLGFINIIGSLTAIIINTVYIFAVIIVFFFFYISGPFILTHLFKVWYSCLKELRQFSRFKKV